MVLLFSLLLDFPVLGERIGIDDTHFSVVVETDHVVIWFRGSLVGELNKEPLVTIFIDGFSPRGLFA